MKRRPNRQAPAHSRDVEHLQRLAERGIVTLGTGKPVGRRKVKPRRTSPTVADHVIEDRR